MVLFSHQSLSAVLRMMEPFTTSVAKSSGRSLPKPWFSLALNFGSPLDCTITAGILSYRVVLFDWYRRLNAAELRNAAIPLRPMQWLQAQYPRNRYAKHGNLH